MAKDPAIDLKKITTKWETPNSYGNYKYPPEKSGVYAVVATDLNLDSDCYGDRELVYIGSTSNLKTRYVGHEVLKVLRAMFPINHVAFYFFETTNYKNYEKRLIKKLEPRINCHVN